MKYRVRHVTEYKYEEPVALSHNAARLVPRSEARQLVSKSTTTVDPTPAVVSRFVDYYGNVVDSFTLQSPHTTLTILTDTVVDIDKRTEIDASRSPDWRTIARFDADLPYDVAEQKFESPLVPRSSELADLAEPHFTADRPVLEAGLALCAAIHRDFAYDPSATTVATPVMEVLAKKRGVCQDFSQVMLGALRSIGLPARYVSGYLETTPPPGRPRLVGADASHAWVQLYCGPELGFVDLDPTNDCIPDDRHVTVAYGRDFSDVSPVKGMILGGGRTHVKVGVDVERLG